MDSSPEPFATRQDAPVEGAQRMFSRVLVSWAADVLELRRRDLLLPRWSRVDPAHLTGHAEPCQAQGPVLPMNDAA